MKPYTRFGLMILTSTTIMHGLMYLNNYSFDHVFFSATRFYMTLIMGATMAVVMLAFMLHMLENRTYNIAILIVSAVIFSTSLFLVRSQTLVDDVAYMKGMIPHHSIAILTSERAKITDPRVQKLAEEIIEAQERRNS